MARERLKSNGNDLPALRLLARSSIRLGRDRPSEPRFTADSWRPKLWNQKTPSCLAWLPAVRVILSRRSWSGRRRLKNLPSIPSYCSSLANLLARMQRFDESQSAGPAAGCGSRLAGLRAAAAGHQPVFDRRPRRGGGGPRSRARTRPRGQQGALGPRGVSQASGEMPALTRPSRRGRRLAQTAAGAAAANAPADTEAAWLASRSALQQKQLDRFQVELARSGAYRALNPLVAEPSLYSGSAKCGTCHPEISRAHAATRHSRTFHHGAELLLLPRATAPLADPDDSRVTHTLRTGGHEAQGTQQHLQRGCIELLVYYAFGTKDRYLTMVGRDGDGGSRALRLSSFP